MNIMRRTIAAALLTAAASTAALGQDASNSLKVRVDWLPWGIHAGLHLAAEKGWFKDAGLNVEISDGKGSSLTMQQVAAGEIEVGQVQLSAMAAARGQGMPLISIAGLARLGDLGAIVPKDKGLKTVKDLEGKKVAYTAASGWGPLADPFFVAGGTDRSKIDLVNVDASSLLSVYAAGTVDAVLTTYPFAKPTADRKRPSEGILLASVGINLPSYGLITNTRTLQTKEAALKKFVPIVVRAWEYIYAGHIDEAVKAIASQRANEKLDLDIVRDQIVEFQPFFETENTKGKKFGWQSEKDWQGTIDVLAKVGTIPAGSKTSDYFTNAFVTE